MLVFVKIKVAVIEMLSFILKKNTEISHIKVFYKEIQVVPILFAYSVHKSKRWNNIINDI